ncbi:unnamed protein product [Rhizoctonia solani]|uniref:Uncharacterized protein n=1 Tax=Rhizoctonia solani TaxID=456999 RepID=A0A8H3GKT6_9AGAM|nr:unnamed protein product [Rhizoctonia solani]
MHNPALYWDTPRFSTPGPVDLACEMIYHLPKSPGKLWVEEWFQAKIHEGVCKIRGAFTHSVQVHYAEIFGFHNTAFNTRSERPNLPKVQALQNFLHINKKDNEGNIVLGVFFRDAMIVKVLWLLLLGRSSIVTGKQSSKAQKSYRQLWHIKCITLLLLAFAATMIHFVLLGNPFFEAGSGSLQYPAWFHARLRLLEGIHENHPNIFDDLIQYYNKEVLGIDLQGADNNQDGGAPLVLDDGMDANDMEFLAMVQA